MPGGSATARGEQRAEGSAGGAAVGESLPLDQWRGFALLLVLVSHGFYFTGRVSGIGRVGVNLFFFISGLLVYRSLVRSSAPDFTGRAIGFWKSRIRRLYPALLGYLILGIPLTFLLQDIPTAAPDGRLADYLHTLPRAMAYGMNFAAAPVPAALHHLWSLSTEVQFYLLGPLIFWAGGTALSRRRWVWGTLLGVLMAIGMAQPRFGELVKYYFQFSVWPMMLGFVAEAARPQFETFCRVVAKPALVLSVFALLLSMGLMMLGTKAKVVVIAIGAAMIFPCYCAYVAGIAIEGPFGRLLTWLGSRTYSIYLWQQPFTLCGYLPPVMHPVGAILACGVGAVSFRWLEAPFMRRRGGRAVGAAGVGAKTATAEREIPAAAGR